MSDFKEITTKAMALPSESRAELAEILIQSLEEKDDEDIKSAWLTEISRRDQEIRPSASVTKPADQVLKEIKKRVQEIKSGKAKGRPAEEVLAEIRAKYS